MNKIVFLVLLGIMVPLVVFANENVEEKKEKKDYYEPKVQPERKKSYDEQVSLTRDWYGRENPDQYPLNGFFPVWPAMLLGLSGFFVFLSFVSAAIHLFGGYGKRAEIEAQNKEYELEQKKLLEHQERRKSA